MATIAPPSPTPTKIPNYRQQLRKELPEHFFKPHYGNLLWFVVHFAIIGTGFWLLRDHFSWWLAPICSLVIGHSMACMGFLAHDIGHGGTIKNLFLRDFLAGLGFSPLAIGPYLWRRWHNSDHHNNTQVEGVDPDHLFTMEDYKHNPILKGLYRLSPLARNLVIFSSFTYRMTQQQIRMVVTYLKSPKSSNADRVVILAELFVPLAAWILGTWMLGTQVLIWGYLVPVLVANSIAISYIATNHFLNPLADEKDVLATSLSVTLPSWLSWLDAWHSSFGSHVSHHLFPQASSKYSRRIEAKVAELYPDRYHAMPIFTALRLLWQTPWIYEDHTTFVDPHRQERAPTLGHGLNGKFRP